MPSCRRALRVGVTGHRLDKLAPAALDALRCRLREVFAALDAALGRCENAEAPRLVSALAEGADRLAAEAAPESWRLVALLPLPRAEYRRDFLGDGEQDSGSTRAFEAHLGRAEIVVEPGAAFSDREAAYAALGRSLVRDVDCLLAIWDGRPPRGPGGTAAVLADAVASGLPVLWLDPNGAAPPRRITGFVQGDVLRPQAFSIDEAALDGIIELTSRSASR